MAEIARSISDFSREGVVNKPNQTKTIAKSEEPSVPSDFLSFYKNIIGFVEQYKEAFEDENFNRMAQFVVVINSTILKYFAKSSDLEKVLKKLADGIIDDSKNFVERKKTEYLTIEEIQQEISRILQQYKEKLFSKIQELVKGKSVPEKTSNDEGQSSDNKEAEKYVYKFNKKIEAIGEDLKLTLNSGIMSAVKKVNAVNLSEISAQSKFMLDSHVSNVGKTLENLKKEKDKVLEKTTTINLEEISKNFSSKSDNTIDNIDKKTEAAAKRHLGKGFFGKITGTVVGFFGIVKKILSFAISAVVFVVKTAMKILLGAAKLVYAVGKVLLKTGAAISYGVFKLGKFVLKKIWNFSITQLLWKGFKKFIFSYPGAFMIGFIVGRIWRSVLLAAGVSEEDIASGNFSIIEDVVSPLYETWIKEPLKKFFGNGTSPLISLKDRIWKRITNEFEKLRKEHPIIDKIIDFGKKSYEDIKDIFGYAKDLFIPLSQAALKIIHWLTDGGFSETLETWRFFKILKWGGAFKGLTWTSTLAAGLTLGPLISSAMSGGGALGFNLFENGDPETNQAELRKEFQTREQQHAKFQELNSANMSYDQKIINRDNLVYLDNQVVEYTSIYDLFNNLEQKSGFYGTISDEDLYIFYNRYKNQIGTVLEGIKVNGNQISFKDLAASHNNDIREILRSLRYFANSKKEFFKSKLDNYTISADAVNLEDNFNLSLSVPSLSGLHNTSLTLDTRLEAQDNVRNIIYDSTLEDATRMLEEGFKDKESRDLYLGQSVHDIAVGIATKVANGASEEETQQFLDDNIQTWSAWGDNLLKFWRLGEGFGAQSYFNDFIKAMYVNANSIRRTAEHHRTINQNATAAINATVTFEQRESNGEIPDGLTQRTIKVQTGEANALETAEEICDGLVEYVGANSSGTIAIPIEAVDALREVTETLTETTEAVTEN